MRYIVTGGCGFIGSHLVDTLQQQGEEVVVVDDLRSGRTEHIAHHRSSPSFHWIQGSITDLSLLIDAFQDADGIFHQAAFVSIPDSVRDPATTHTINLQGTLNVLLAARECHVPKVVFASSAAIYGDRSEIPLREDLLPSPLSPYAVTKVAGEYYCQVFSHLYGVSTVCLRYFNVYGPRQDPHSPYAAVIPSFLSRLLAGMPVIIEGDGKQTRDFIYVKDVVQANLLAMKQNVSGTYNIASGTMTSINDLARTCMEILNVSRDFEFRPSRPGDLRDSCACIERAQKDLGFSPRYTLQEGLEEMIAPFHGRPVQS